MADAPYARLRALLVRGAIAPGTAVSEAALAERLAVSRTPVRQAMQRLVREGLLVVTGGGARPRVAAAPLDAEEARECYELVGALEGRAARAAASWPTAARDALADALAERDAAFRAEGRRRPPAFDRLYERHAAFHDRLRDATAGPVTRGLLEVLAPRVDRYQWFQAPVLEQAAVPMSPAHAEHEAIVQALRQGDADRLEQAVRENWQQAAHRLATALAGGGGEAPPARRRRR